MNQPQQSFELTRCHTFLGRLKGFVGRREIAENELLWLQPCAAVHTFGMRVPLSLIFIDRQRRCVKMIENATPGRVYGCFKAWGVIEMRARHAEQISAVWRVIEPTLQGR